MIVIAFFHSLSEGLPQGRQTYTDEVCQAVTVPVGTCTFTLRPSMPATPPPLRLPPLTPSTPAISPGT